MKKKFIEIFNLEIGRIKFSIKKRQIFFSDLLIEFEKNKNNYFLNLVGYYDNNFKKFLKLFTLYFFLKFFFDIIFFIFRYILIEFYLFIIEIIFNILFDLRMVSSYLIFNKYLKKYPKLIKFIIKIDHFYYKIISWFFLLFTFNKINIFAIKRFFRTFTFFKLIDYIYIFFSNILWFFFTRKETRKKYLLIKKLIIDSIYYCFLIIASIYTIIMEYSYLIVTYFFFHHKAKTYDFLNLKKEKARAKTKRKLFMLIFLKYFKEAWRYFVKKFLYLLWLLFRFFKRIIKAIITFFRGKK